ncbi:MAG: ABC transporter permease [Clostridia bacterium]|nr:ABC transporter permease [Clostridia bacterium]
MNTISALTRRNIKLFFKDKGMFFSSMITPIILLVLYSTFLSKVYKDIFISIIPQSLNVSDKIINALANGQLVSSLLAVCCITVAFCSNLIMVQDKHLGTRRDFTVSPVKSSTLSLSYYLATAANTLTVCLSAFAVCLIYTAATGWVMGFTDVLLMLADIFLLVMFGTALSSIINSFLSTQGQMSAVGTIVSAGYGFICGAYMPISQFGEGLRNLLSLLPGTYGTALIRNHAMSGALNELSKLGLPAEFTTQIRDSIDCNLYFFNDRVSIPAMYTVLAGSCAVLISVYILMNFIRQKKSAA